MLGIASIAVAALVMRLTADDNEQPSPTAWADSVCASLSTWRSSITAISDVSGQTLTSESLQQSLGEATTATETLVTDLRQLGPPDLDAGDDLKQQLDSAASELDRASDLCRTVGWVSFAPWPQALRAEAYLLAGHTEIASDLFEAAFAVGCQIGDPCWEGMGARGIGLVHLRHGRIDQGIEWLDDARRRCIRIPDAYLWIHAYCLDALCAAGIAHERPEARSWIEDLATLAARTGMREMLVRSHLHRSALDGEPALQAARLFARDIDDPLLHGLLDPLAGARSG